MVKHSKFWLHFTVNFTLKLNQVAFISCFFPIYLQRHGAFVWDQFSNDHAERLLKQCGYSVSRHDAKTNGVLNKKQTESRDDDIKQESKDTSEQMITTLPPICT